MKSHPWLGASVVLVAFLTAMPVYAEDGQQHHGGARAGSGAVDVSGAVPVRPVIVRDVQVRDVRVAQPRPAASPYAQTPRPFLPDVISRPQQSPYPSSYSAQSRYPSSYSSSMATDGRRYYRRAPRAGYAVVYPYPYIYPFAYDAQVYGSPFAPSPYPYPYAADAPPPPNTYSNVEALVPGSPSLGSIICRTDRSDAVPCGGLSFDVSPPDAQISVDGVVVGTVYTFLPSQSPLTLSPGVHYLEVRMPGFRTSSFDVTITPGDVTTYQGELEPLRTR